MSVLCGFVVRNSQSLVSASVNGSVDSVEAGLIDGCADPVELRVNVIAPRCTWRREDRVGRR